LFALTPAEIRLAKAIAGGRKLSEVAGLLGVSSETARAHLKSVFAKSGAHSQSELSVLLDRMAGPPDDD
jgi:DNA-binding CsgD family transcriptional regulator